MIKINDWFRAVAIRPYSRLRSSLSARWFYLRLIALLRRRHNNIFLLGTPNHSNMGDHAQTYCALKWLQENYPGYRLYSFNSSAVVSEQYRLLQIIRRYIRPTDKIFIQSGYNTTDLWPREEAIHREVIKLFPDFKIVVLPQTVFFEKDEERQKTMDIYNSHPDLVFMSRDQVSYTSAKQMFNRAKLILFPDLVTMLIGERMYDTHRDGILFCIRNDKEALYKKDDINALKQRVEQWGSVQLTDTTLSLDCSYIERNRESVLCAIFNEYSRYKLIITDRYHGLIFSLVAGTPVIVLSSRDHKLSSGVDWFTPHFKGYVYYAESLDSAEKMCRSILNRNYTHQLPPIFKTEYFGKLKGILGNESVYEYL